VASEDSLVPGFVIELFLPELAVNDEYTALLDEMRKRSLGVLWFDSSDADACDFAWRLGLRTKVGAPLFCFEGIENDVSLDGFEIGPAQPQDRTKVVELLTSAPADAGGQTKSAAEENFDGGCVAVLKKGKDILGAAVLTPIPGHYLALASVVMETYSNLAGPAHEKAHRDLELIFMNTLARQASQRHFKLVYSMAAQTPEGYVEAVKLKMQLVKQGFMANLGTSW
jgi:hypothetical protein